MTNKKDENANRKFKEIIVLKKDVPKEIIKNIEMGRKAYANIIPRYNYNIICIGSKELDGEVPEHRAFCITEDEYQDDTCNFVYRKLWRYDIKRRRYYAPYIAHDTAE